MVFNLFKKQSTNLSVSPLTVDVHSHLLPGIDDGVKDWDESVNILKSFIELGYKKVITTPHIFSDHYPNTPEIILSKLHELKLIIHREELDIEVDAAAEYYLDENFMRQFGKGQQLLTFGDKYLLFETSFINKPNFLIEALFQITASGYKPVMAHPERYGYLYSDENLLKELLDRDILMQVNLNSLIGYYSKQSKKFAEKLIDLKCVAFIGTDCHNLRHVSVIKEVIKSKNFKKIKSLKLLNNNL